MSTPTTTFEVEDVFHVTGCTDTYVAGKIKSGVVSAGMQVKIWVEGGLFMFAPIKSIEFIRDQERRSDMALALDTPEEEVPGLWKDLCRKGNLLTVEPGGKG